MDRKKWFVPAALMGMGGMGLLLLSDRGRSAMRWARHRFQDAPEQLQDWNERVQQEVTRIQQQLDELANRLEAAR
jgi:hypothetical protein